MRFVESDTDQNNPGIFVDFNEPPTYKIGYCTNDIVFTMPQSVAPDAIWTVTKTESELILQCNGEKIYKYMFSESCASNWVLENANYILFMSGDSASTAYRKYSGGTSVCCPIIEHTFQIKK